MAPTDVSFSDEAREQVMAKLEAVGADGPCLRCGNDTMALWQNYFHLIASADPQGVRELLYEGFSTGPFAAACCPKCGWLALHSVQVLGAPTV